MVGMVEFKERRITHILCSCWDTLKGDKNYPKKDEMIELQEVKDIWPYCFVVKINETDDETRRYNFIHLGDIVAEIYDMDTDTVFLPPIIDHVYHHLDSVLTNKEPIMGDLDLQDSVGHQIIGRQCFLPLSEDGQEVNYILSAVSCRREKYDYFYDVNT